MSKSDRNISPTLMPKPADYAFDLDRTLRSVVALRATVPDDAFTASTLGTERAGSAVHIRPGVFLTIGYLITEADTVWLSTTDGQAVPGHAMAYDQETGFGLVQALGKLSEALETVHRVAPSRLAAAYRAMKLWDEAIASSKGTTTARLNINSLSLRMGPPTEPPNWFRRNLGELFTTLRRLK